jgi:hypothetical protein
MVQVAEINVTITAYQPILPFRNFAIRGMNSEPAKGIAQHNHAAYSAGIKILFLLLSFII